MQVCVLLPKRTKLEFRVEESLDQGGGCAGGFGAGACLIPIERSRFRLGIDSPNRGIEFDLGNVAGRLKGLSQRAVEEVESDYKYRCVRAKRRRAGTSISH